MPIEKTKPLRLTRPALFRGKFRRFDNAAAQGAQCRSRDGKRSKKFRRGDPRRGSKPAIHAEAACRA
jgi:hypothetical protein